MAKKYKHPSDYPQFAFRLSKQDKEFLLKEVGAIHRLANKSLSDDDFKIKRNEIILMALKEGLKQVKKLKKWNP